MENPFELMLEKQNNMETLLRQLLNNPVQGGISGGVEVEKPMTTKQAAEFLGISASAVRHNDDIPRYKRGGILFFYKSELNQYIKTGFVKISAKTALTRKTPTNRANGAGAHE
ncbi:helix-turn-helix domain-containing protein [Fibrella forsythiae]|uniref:Helix-turn-helix domain-containing protein n=1 Tax=Fibrella forsythiae TaxID=2817061 RepID=A0ABS3JBI2_9BACT|nr:helix-turn-helix domain-containing protein [Fibrella forsythiae]MBO0947351.1 helix-turn-helix domain-containing protein [Fibrella forsythiae]